MKKAIFLFFLLLISLHVYCQSGWQWAKHIGGTGMDNADIFHIDNEQSVYVRGFYAKATFPQWQGVNCIIDDTINLSGYNSSFIAKYHKNGNLVWVHNLAPNNYSLVGPIVYDSVTESFFMAGSFYDSVNLQVCKQLGSGQNFFLYKMDLNGNCIWSRNIGKCPNYSALTCDRSGNLYMAGSIPPGCTTLDTLQVEPGTFIAKFNPDGSCLWAKTITPDSDNYIYITKLIFQNNDLYAFGTINGPGGNLVIDTITWQIPLHNHPMGIICMDSSAHAKWLLLDAFPVGALDYKSCGANDQGDFYCLVGINGTTFLGHDTLVSPGVSRVVVKYNKDGVLLGYNQIIFETTYTGQNGMGLSVQNDSTYYLTGSFSGTASFGSYTITAEKDPDLFLVHYRDSGECLGVDHIGGGQGTSIASDGTGVYITGVFSPQPSNTGSMTIGTSTFQTYGFEDIVFAKHDLLTGAEEKKTAIHNTLIIYANPNKGSFRVVIPDDLNHEKNLVLTIYDNKGRVIRREPLNVSDETPRIDIPGASQGVYPITLSNGETTYRGKLVVE
jgi:hypothetical protein